VNWTETPLFEFYLSGQETNIDSSLFTEEELDQTLDEMKSNYDKYRDNVED
jgi:hypothetical protein